MNFYHKNNSHYFYSITIHLLIVLLFVFIKFSPDEEMDEYVTIGYGSIGRISSTGNLGKNEKNLDKTLKTVKVKKVVEPEKKTVDVPKTVNTEEKNVVIQKDREKKEIKSPEELEKPLVTQTDNEGETDTDHEESENRRDLSACRQNSGLRHGCLCHVGDKRRRDRKTGHDNGSC